MKRLWQIVMIKLAKSKKIKNFAQNDRTLSELATKFVGGTTVKQALQTAEQLNQKNIRASLFYLGEYVDNDQLVQQNLENIETIIEELNSSNLDMHVSVDPTQVGCSINWRNGCQNIGSLVNKLNSTHRITDNGIHCLMLDMEDYNINKKTIELHDTLFEEKMPIALTLQAYLHKTQSDIERLICSNAKIRLVKGAFVASDKVAYTNQNTINGNYKKLIELMLSEKAKAHDFYPIFATHDSDLQTYAIKIAKEKGWPKGSYEFEMLYGVRTDIAEQLAKQGECIRLYMTFGAAWSPYAVRRIGESPKNARILMKCIFNK